MSKSSEKVKRWRHATKDRIVESMGGRCVVCGYSRCNSSLDLHHLNPEEKDFSFASALASPKSWTKFVVELRKCVLVCRNCHGEIHEGVAEVPTDAKRFDENFVNYTLPSYAMDQCWCGAQKIQANKHCSRECAARKGWLDRWDSDPHSLH